MFSGRALRSVVFFALFALPALAGINYWTIKGPGGGNVNKLAFDPVDPTIAYAAECGRLPTARRRPVSH